MKFRMEYGIFFFCLCQVLASSKGSVGAPHRCEIVFLHVQIYSPLSLLQVTQA